MSTPLLGYWLIQLDGWGSSNRMINKGANTANLISMSSTEAMAESKAEGGL